MVPRRIGQEKKQIAGIVVIRPALMSNFIGPGGVPVCASTNS